MISTEFSFCPYPLNQLIKLSDAEYFAAPGLNQSGVKDLMQSAKHYYARNIEGKRKPPTPAMQFGSLVHLAILQTDEFEKRAYFEPVLDKRTIAGKADFKIWQDAMPEGAIVVPIEDKEPLFKMIASWKEHPLYEKLKDSCEFEQAIFWKDEATGVLCKAKFDLVTVKPIEHKGIVIPPGLCGDLKTTTDARADEFIKSIFNYEYDIQAAWYLDGLKASGISDGESYLWFALEKDSPYEIEAHTMESVYFESAREINHLMRLRYKKCIETGVWPGYKKHVKSLFFTSWQIENRTDTVEYLRAEMGA